RYSRAGLHCVRRRLRQDQRGAAAGALVMDDVEARLPGCVCAADRNVIVRAESRQIAACPKGDEALVPEELAVPVIRQIVQPGFVRDQKSALQLDPGVIDRGVEPAALALLRLKVGGYCEACWREPHELTCHHRPRSERHDKDRAVDLLRRAPDARELLLDAPLPGLTLGDQRRDE